MSLRILIASLVSLGAFSTGLPTGLAAEDSESAYDNLRVLPQDITEDALLDVMLENLRGLGLPRLEGRGCLYCHVGDLEKPRSTWDYATDDNPMKHKARVMMAMVEAINKDHLGALERRNAPNLRVTCSTCHAGRTDPRPLDEVLDAEYASGGVAAVEARYEALREGFFSSDAYDFRPGVLNAMAVELADRGAMDDALAIATLNVEHNPGNAAAASARARLILERVILADGAAAAIRELERLMPTLPEDARAPVLLDSLGWRLHRAGHPDLALALFQHNRTRFPSAYTTHESVAFALSVNDKEAAYEILEAWLANHPEHDRARRLLINMRSRP